MVFIMACSDQSETGEPDSIEEQGEMSGPTDIPVRT